MRAARNVQESETGVAAPKDESQTLTWTSLGTKIPQNSHGLFALFDGPTLDSRHKLVFSIKGTRLAREMKAFFSSDLGDGSSR